MISLKNKGYMFVRKQIKFNKRFNIKLKVKML